MATTIPAGKRVFINCPFDTLYKPLFDATVFAIHDLGFQARHALIDDDESSRLTRIAKEIADSTYSIHDLSRVELSGLMKVPRFNMPFEAGIAYCRHLYPKSPSEKHHILLLDAKPYRYQASLSDVAGLDPKIHGNKPETVIDNVRSFLSKKSQKTNLPGATHVWKRYNLFKSKLPRKAQAGNISMAELKTWDYVPDLQNLMVAWIKANPA
jgi:hypothetical protein